MVVRLRNGRRLECCAWNLKRMAAQTQFQFLPCSRPPLYQNLQGCQASCPESLNICYKCQAPMPAVSPYLYSTFHALVATGVCAIAWFRPGLGEGWFRAVEAAFARFATHKKRVLASVFLAAIGIRLLLLPSFLVPVPGFADELLLLTAIHDGD